MNIGVDLGGHTIIAALIAGDKIVRREEIATPPSRELGEVLCAIEALIGRVAGSDEPQSAGITIPGMLDMARRRMLKLPNFPGWDGVDFIATVESRGAESLRGIKVVIENDANCYALGEGTAGAARGCADYVVFTLGTGIGGGVVVGGKLVTGAHGMGGEIGHAVVWGDAPCGCGGRGHLETLAAADGTQKRAREAGLPVDFKALWARRGEAAVDVVLHPTIDALGRGVATMMQALDPEIVVLGGGMSRAPGIADAVAEAARPYLSTPFKDIINIRTSALGNDAALYGAAAVAEARGI